MTYSFWYTEAMQHTVRRKRKEESSASSQQDEGQQYHAARTPQPQYSEQFVATEKDGERQTLPEFIYGEDWQNVNFVSSHPQTILLDEY